jgi:hypothetical protein
MDALSVPSQAMDRAGTTCVGFAGKVGHKGPRPLPNLAVSMHQGRAVRSADQDRPHGGTVAVVVLARGGLCRPGHACRRQPRTGWDDLSPCAVTCRHVRPRPTDPPRSILSVLTVANLRFRPGSVAAVNVLFTGCPNWHSSSQVCEAWEWFSVPTLSCKKRSQSQG